MEKKKNTVTKKPFFFFFLETTPHLGRLQEITAVISSKGYILVLFLTTRIVSGITSSDFEMSLSSPVFSDISSLAGLLHFLDQSEVLVPQRRGLRREREKAFSLMEASFLRWGEKKSILFALVVGNSRLLELAHSFESAGQTCTWSPPLQPVAPAGFSVLPLIVLARAINGGKLVLNFPSWYLLFLLHTITQQRAGHERSYASVMYQGHSTPANSYWGI